MRNLLVLGDSVMWGQGLLVEHKFSTIVANNLSASVGKAITVAMAAHSGATIGENDPATSPVAGSEVPTAYLTVIEQVQKASTSFDDVAAILINGGINDVNIRCILNPLYSEAELAASIQQNCYSQMLKLLEVTGSYYPSVPVGVLGYYPILSYSSDPLGIDALFGAHMAAELSQSLDRTILRNGVVDNCLQFWKSSTMCLQKAADGANAYFKRAQFKFIDPGFTEENAAFAPQYLLWGVDMRIGKNWAAVDEVTSERCAECAEAKLDPIDMFTCQRASAGHPNVAGAAQIAEQILRAQMI